MNPHISIFSHFHIFTFPYLHLSGLRPLRQAQRPQPPQGKLSDKFENMQIWKCADESPHFHIFTFPHLHILTSSHQLISTSTHQHISTFLYLHPSTGSGLASSHLQILTSSNPHILKFSHWFPVVSVRCTLKKIPLSHFYKGFGALHLKPISGQANLQILKSSNFQILTSSNPHILIFSHWFPMVSVRCTLRKNTIITFL